MKTKPFVTRSLLAAFSLLVASCSTTSFMGLSKASYVDEELRSVEADLEELNSLNDELSDLTRDIEEALASDQELREALDELNSMAGDFSRKLDEIPDQTLRELVEAIETYLRDTPSAGASVSGD